MRARLFLVLLLTYIAVLGGHLYSGDELMMARVAEALVTRGELAVRPIEGFEDYARVKGADARSYTWYGLAPSLVAVPFYALGMAAETVVPDSGLKAFDAPAVLFYDRTDKAEVIRAYAVSFVNPFVTALTASLLVGLFLRLGLPAGFALAAGATYGLTGVVPFHAKTFFSEPLAGLCLLSAAAAWLRMREGGRRAILWALAAGAALGGAVLTRVALGIVLFPATAAFLWDLARRREAPQGPAPVALAASAAAGAAAPLALLAAYNLARFGTATETGYSGVMNLFGGDAVEGLAGLLASPGRGLFLYCPWALAALAGLPALTRRDRPLGLFIAGVLAALLALYAPWAMWDGGWGFGPRFLLPALPLLALPAALAIHRAWHRPAVRIATALVGLISLALAVQSVRVNFEDYHFAIWSTQSSPDAAVRWDWAWSPIVRYWTWPRQDFVLLPRLLVGDGGAALCAFAWTLLAGLVAAFVALVRAVPPGIRPPSPPAPD